MKKTIIPPKYTDFLENPSAAVHLDVIEQQLNIPMQEIYLFKSANIYFIFVYDL